MKNGRWANPLRRDAVAAVLLFFASIEHNVFLNVRPVRSELATLFGWVAFSLSIYLAGRIGYMVGFPRGLAEGEYQAEKRGRDELKAYLALIGATGLAQRFHEEVDQNEPLYTDEAKQGFLKRREDFLNRVTITFTEPGAAHGGSNKL
jgi:hypothetical protein